MSRMLAVTNYPVGTPLVAAHCVSPLSSVTNSPSGVFNFDNSVPGLLCL